MRLRMAAPRSLIMWIVGCVAMAAVVALVVVVAPWLLTRYPHHGLTADQALKAKNDVRTTLIQALAGIAVAGGLVVTYRSYRLSKSQQVTETYTKAIEQLGHTDAPVRLGALYSLEHLGQDNPDRRQTVIDVLCAYLRMPYTPPPTADPNNETDTAATTEPDPGQRHRPQQELQVRKTAQRLLAAHVQRPPNAQPENAAQMNSSRQLAFWPGINLDLTGATLVDFELHDAVVQADFHGANFIGDASFCRATFTGNARYDRATFTGNARYDGATFTGNARYDGAIFNSDAWYDGATFNRDALFGSATFTRRAGFDGATFTGRAWFDRATFTGRAWFHGATFTDAAEFDGARVRNLDVAHERLWPAGWTVRVNPDDSTSGRLVRSDPMAPGTPHTPVVARQQTVSGDATDRQ